MTILPKRIVKLTNNSTFAQSIFTILKHCVEILLTFWLHFFFAVKNSLEHLPKCMLFQMGLEKQHCLGNLRQTLSECCTRPPGTFKWWPAEAGAWKNPSVSWFWITLSIPTRWVERSSCLNCSVLSLILFVVIDWFFELANWLIIHSFVRYKPLFHGK